MGITDSAGLTVQVHFPSRDTTLGAGQFLVLYADKAQRARNSPRLQPQSQRGRSFTCTTSRPTAGRCSIRSYSVSRFAISPLAAAQMAHGNFADRLSAPTTRSLALGRDRMALRINEWLADELFLANNDFIEFYNPSSLPVGLGRLLSLECRRSAGTAIRFPSLSFIAAGWIPLLRG